MKLAWLKDVARVAPLILPFTGVPAVLIPFISKGIELAESTEGASGEQKLQIAKDEVANGIAAVNAARPNSIDPGSVNSAVEHGIAATVSTLNAIHSAR